MTRPEDAKPLLQGIPFAAVTKIPKVSRLSILLVLVGTVAAAIFGRTDFDGVGDADIASSPTSFAFGAPIFVIGAVISSTIVVLLIIVETTADILTMVGIIPLPVLGGAAITLFFNVFRPGSPSDPSIVAAGPAVVVREDEAEVLGQGGSYESGRPKPRESDA